MDINEKEIIKNFLIEIESDIAQIDGGCSNCIDEFLSGRLSKKTLIRGLALKL